MVAASREGEILEGKYRLLRKIGEGAMGAVYAGENLRIKRTVAIKILHAAASAIAEMADRFEREAQAAGHIGNDHIAEVYDLGTTSKGERYMVLEYLEGETLRARIKRQKRLEPRAAVDLLLQLVEGLGAAHRAGIIHRDVKPDNVFIMKEKAGRRDFVKILDFGISKFTQQVGEGSATRTGTVMGSPNYMSPEHVRGTHEVDARSDLYSAGVILYEALTGSIPRSANNFAELLFKIAYEPIPDPRAIVADLPARVVDVVMRACAADVTTRYQDADELIVALRGAQLDLAGEVAVRPAPPSNAGASSTTTAGASSQPSFQSAPKGPFGGASQPAFSGSGSQPGFSGSGSQPAFSGSGSQPAFGNASPSYRSFVRAGDTSQPDANGTAIMALDFEGGSRSGVRGPLEEPMPPGGGSTAAPLSLTTGAVPPPVAPAGSRAKAFGIAIGCGVAVGVLGILGYVFLAGPPTADGKAAASGPAPAPSSSAAPASTSRRDPTEASASGGVETTPSAETPSSGVASVAATGSSASASASAKAGSSRPVSNTRPVRPRGPDPGY